MTYYSPESGLLLVYKEPGITSYDVIRKLKKQLQIKKIGHSGTLDPFAQGLLVILTGSMTRLFDLFNTLKKTYRGTVIFGQETDTLDSTGTITAEAPPPSDISLIQEAVNSFCGIIKQTPPDYSSVHINGVRAYTLARKGIKPEIKEKEVNIYSIKVNSYQNNTLDFTVTCSSGTYIRSLARDIGRKCNSAAYLAELKRISIGDFKAEDAALPENICINNIIKPIDGFTKLDIPCLIVKDGFISDVLKGKKLKNHYFSTDPVLSYVAVFTKNNDFLALIDNFSSEMKYIFAVPEKCRKK